LPISRDFASITYLVNRYRRCRLFQQVGLVGSIKNIRVRR
jgi:hypothetical protein